MKIITTSMLKNVTYLLAVLCLSTMVSNIAHARQLDDVTLPDNISLPGSGVNLQLNGMGYRTKFVFDVYVGALYIESKATSRDAVQALTGPKRIVMHMVYDEVSKEKMTSAWNEGFEENNSAQRLEELRSRLSTFISYFPDLKKRRYRSA